MSKVDFTSGYKALSSLAILYAPIALYTLPYLPIVENSVWYAPSTPIA
mgnify:CR=1 FL=1